MLNAVSGGGVADGDYRVRYDPPGEWGVLTGGLPKLFQVAAGKPPVKLEERLVPVGRLSGRVIDGGGKAVAKALVEIAGPRSTNQLPTDAQGKFDLRQPLLPGAFTLSVIPPVGFKPPDPGQDSDRVLAWARTYYPGVALPEAASKIVLPPGGKLADIELKLLAVAAHPVRGVLLDPDGRPAPKVEISLAGRAQSLHAESKPDGTFEFAAVVDGGFYLTSEMESAGVKLRARQWLEMSGHQQEGVKLQLNAPFTVHARR